MLNRLVHFSYSSFGKISNFPSFVLSPSISLFGSRSLTLPLSRPRFWEEVCLSGEDWHICSGCKFPSSRQEHFSPVSSTQFGFQIGRVANWAQPGTGPTGLDVSGLSYGNDTVEIFAYKNISATFKPYLKFQKCWEISKNSLIST